MAGKPLSTEEFIKAWHAANCAPEAVARLTGLTPRAVYGRRKKLVALGVVLPTIPSTSIGRANTVYSSDAARSYIRERQADISDGVVVVFSDAHFWPQEQTVANLALLEVIKALKPKRLIANGDIFDGARISRHAPLGWAELPTVKEEIEICQERMHEIRMAAQPKKTQCEFDWNIGNHDQRFDKFLVAHASEMAGSVPRLQDKFPEWEMAWSLKLNNKVMIKHRWHNGIHATYNNALKGGMSIVTGHLHRLCVTPWADYTGRRWGVDTGTLSDPHLPQFDYGENNATPHTPGFAVLTFKDGELLPPELVEVIGDVAYFRGQVVIDGRKQKD
jgi:hypothetical protein